MSGFSPEWLALREPVDHRSRDAALAAELQSAFTGRSTAAIVDLGCGTGSNLRGTFQLLPAEQQWTLIDYDPRLLAAARQVLSHWTGANPQPQGDTLILTPAGKRLEVTFRQADLNTGLDAALGPAPDLVTASAFFDLCSERFIERLATAVAARRAAFFTVLTYNGEQVWTPTHAADHMMRQSFCAHQLSDKGFGASSGPSAPGALARAFRAAGYRVSDGDSPWRLGPADLPLTADLATGFAAAVTETGTVHADVVASWSAVVRTGAIVGHTDTLALPPFDSEPDPMPDIVLLRPENYRRQPWKNGGGELVNIAGEGTGSWQDKGVAWQYGRTAIVSPGPFSDLTGYDRRQVVIKGRGLVLVTATGEIDLREPFRPVRYDGATPIVTRLESGPVEVVNLIADRTRFRTDLRVGPAGETLDCEPGTHVIHAADGAASLKLSGQAYALRDDQALRLTSDVPFRVEIVAGRVLVASVHRLAP